MLQRDGVVMMVMKVLVMRVMMMMISMKSSSMAMMTATISPLREGISPADFCLPESFLSLYVFCPVEAVESISDPLVLGFQGDDICEGTLAEVGQGGHATGWRGLGLARTTWWCAPWPLTSPSPSGYFYLPMIYEFLGIFLELLIFRNMVS
jgi:hypothetical protein